MKPVVKRIVNDIWFDLSHPSLINLEYYFGFLYNVFHARASNEPDYSSEIFFWEQAYYKYHVSGDHPTWWDETLTRNRYSEDMRMVLDILINKFNKNLRLIDVGSGPVTSFFDKLDITSWEIVTVDPLAKLYNKLNKNYDVRYSIKCTEGVGEQVDKLFNPDSFHLVLSQNALDHCTSPPKFINNLVHICKPGGIIYLSGFIREGSSANWLGLHKHDLYVMGNDLCWTNWNNTANNINITENLDITLFQKEVSGCEPGDRFKLIYMKNLEKN